jgi:hypothetical protein
MLIPMSGGHGPCRAMTAPRHIKAGQTDMSWNPKDSDHIDKIRLITAATAKFELTVEELRHMVRCEECLDTFWGLRDPFRPTKQKAPKRAA